MEDGGAGGRYRDGLRLRKGDNDDDGVVVSHILLCFFVVLYYQLRRLAHFLLCIP